MLVFIKIMSDSLFCVQNPAGVSKISDSEMKTRKHSINADVLTVSSVQCCTEVVFYN